MKIEIPKPIRKFSLFDTEYKVFQNDELSSYLVEVRLLPEHVYVYHSIFYNYTEVINFLSHCVETKLKNYLDYGFK